MRNFAWLFVLLAACASNAPETSDAGARAAAGASAEALSIGGGLFLPPCNLRSSVDRTLLQAYANVANHFGVSMNTCSVDGDFRPNGGYFQAYRCGSGSTWAEFLTVTGRQPDRPFDADVYILRAGGQGVFWFPMHCECSGCYARTN